MWLSHLLKAVRLGVWKNAASQRRLTSIVKSVNSDSTSIEATYKLPTVNATCSFRYLFDEGNQMRVRMRYVPGEKQVPAMPRFGMQLAVQKDFNMVTWYGRGPHETY